MITNIAIQEAIAYCNGKLDPGRDDAILLAACYILQDHMHSSADAHSYSNAADSVQASIPQSYRDYEPISRYGDSDFMKAIEGKDAAEAWKIMDELMRTLKVVNERLYNAVMRRLQ